MTVLTREEEAMILGICASEMRRLGYPTDARLGGTRRMDFSSLSDRIKVRVRYFRRQRVINHTTV
jgi:hypothetical protein